MTKTLDNLDKLLATLSETERRDFEALRSVEISPVHLESLVSRIGRILCFIVFVVIQIDLLASKELECVEEGISAHLNARQILMQTCYLQGPISEPLNTDEPFRISEYSRIGLIVILLIIPYTMPIKIWEKFLFRKEYQEAFGRASCELQKLNMNYLAKREDLEQRASEVLEELYIATDWPSFKTNLSVFKVFFIFILFSVYIIFFKLLLPGREDMENSLLFVDLLQSLLNHQSPLLERFLPQEVICDSKILVYGQSNRLSSARLTCLLNNAVNYTLLLGLWQIFAVVLALFLIYQSLWDLFYIWNDFHLYLSKEVQCNTFFQGCNIALVQEEQQVVSEVGQFMKRGLRLPNYLAKELEKDGDTNIDCQSTANTQYSNTQQNEEENFGQEKIQERLINERYLYKTKASDFFL